MYLTMKKAMILAAGLGTRMQPITLTRPKALVEVKGISLLERNILYLKTAGIQDIVINVHHFAQQIQDFLAAKQNFGISIHISDESEAVLETGGGLLRAKPFLQGDSDFILMNVDMLTNLSLEKLADFHKNKGNALATLAVTERKSSRQLLFNAEMQLKGWENTATNDIILLNEAKTDLKPLAFSGIHLISPRIFDYLQGDGKFSIINAYLELAKNHNIFGYNHSGDLLLDVGKPEAIDLAERMFGAPKKP